MSVRCRWSHWMVRHLLHGCAEYLARILFNLNLLYSARPHVYLYIWTIMYWPVRHVTMHWLETQITLPLTIAVYGLRAPPHDNVWHVTKYCNVSRAGLGDSEGGLWKGSTMGNLSDPGMISIASVTLQSCVALTGAALGGILSWPISVFQKVFFIQL